MSDLEYKNKYLKYKVKYINLRNELELQEGGFLGSLKNLGTAAKQAAEEAAKAAKQAAKEAAKATGNAATNAASKLASATTSAAEIAFWSGHKIVFFYVKDSSNVTFVSPFSDINFKSNNTHIYTNPITIELSALKKDFGENLWYWANKQLGDKESTNKAIRRNIPIISNPVICKLNNLLGVEDTVAGSASTLKFDKKNPADVVDFIKAGIKALSNKNDKDIGSACSKLGNIVSNLKCEKSTDVKGNDGAWYGAWINFGGVKDNVLHLIVKQNPQTEDVVKQNPQTEDVLKITQNPMETQ
jgi:hypothetical protein